MQCLTNMQFGNWAVTDAEKENTQLKARIPIILNEQKSIWPRVNPFSLQNSVDLDCDRIPTSGTVSCSWREQNTPLLQSGCSWSEHIHLDQGHYPWRLSAHHSKAPVSIRTEINQNSLEKGCFLWQPCLICSLLASFIFGPQLCSCNQRPLLAFTFLVSYPHHGKPVASCNCISMFIDKTTKLFTAAVTILFINIPANCTGLLALRIPLLLASLCRNT